MKRTQQSTNFDMSKPVNIEQIKLYDDACFGQLWDPLAVECSQCADCHMCSVVVRHRIVKPKIQKVDESKGPFLDTINFDLIKPNKLAELVKLNQGKYTREEIFELQADKSGTNNPVLINTWIDSFFEKYNITEQNGGLY